MRHENDGEIPNRLQTLKKALDDADRAKKAALMTAVVDSTKALVGANQGLPFLVHRIDDAAAQNKIVDAALKQVRTYDAKTDRPMSSHSTLLPTR